MSYAFLVLVIVLGGIRWFWGYRADSLLQAEVERIRAEGHPVYLTDLAIEPVPDEENAAHYYLLAVPNWHLPPEGDPLDENTPLIADSAAYLASNAENFTLVRKARELDRADWKIEFVSPAVDIEYAQSVHGGRLAKLLADAATRQFELGRDEEGLELIFDMLHLSRAIHQPPSVMITHLVATSVRWLALSTLQAHMSEISFETNREKIQSLIVLLLAEEELDESLLRTIRGERAIVFDGIRYIIDEDSLGGSMDQSRPLVFALRPYYVNDLHHSLIIMENNLDYIRQYKNNAPLTEDAMAKQDEELAINRIYYPFSSMLALTMSVGPASHYRVRAHQRLAATALALRLYELDHGQLPQTLEQLVSTYLPQVPIDVMTAEQRPIQYAPQGIDPWLPSERYSASTSRLGKRLPVVYSAGRNYEDDGGDFELDETGLPLHEGPDADRDQAFLIYGKVPLPDAEHKDSNQ